MTQRNEYLSVNRLKVYEQCPRKYEYSYVRKVKVAVQDQTQLTFGSLLHEALESLYQWVMVEEHTGAIPRDVVGDFFQRAWGKWGAGLNGALFKEASDIFHRYLRENPTANHRDIIGVETEFRIQVGPFQVLGYIDRIDRDGDGVVVLDYKSNRVSFSRDDVESDIQFSVYALAAKELFPWARHVRLAFHMLRHGTVIETTRSEADLEAARQYIALTGQHMEEAMAFPARLNVNCGYCDYREMCSEYQAAITNKIEIVKSSPEDLAAVAAEFDAVTKVSKMAYGRQRELQDILLAAIEAQGDLELNGKKYTTGGWAKHKHGFDKTVATLATSTGIPWREVASKVAVVDDKKLEAYLVELQAGGDRLHSRMLKLELEAVAEAHIEPKVVSSALVKKGRALGA